MGNGNDVFLWYDNWHPKGPLIQKFGHRVVYNSGSFANSKLASVIQDGHARSESLVTILSQLPLIEIGDEDTTRWVSSKTYVFSVSSAWDQIRTQRPKFDWWKVIWFSQAIPRCAFIFWLEIKNRLSTKERLIRRGLAVDLLCVMCKAAVETRNHLFFMYPFSSRIRKRIKYWCCQESIGDDWDDIVAWAENQWKGKSLKSVCSKLGLSVAVYHIWSHRNAIIFQGLIKTEDQIVGLIKKQFKNRVE